MCARVANGRKHCKCKASLSLVPSPFIEESGETYSILVPRGCVYLAASNQIAE